MSDSRASGSKEPSRPRRTRTSPQTEDRIEEQQLGQGTEPDSNAAREAAAELCAMLRLNQAQVAALLGVTPQAVSKAFDEGQDFFRVRAAKLYDSLRFVGGDTYSAAAETLKGYCRHTWGIELAYRGLESTAPEDIYREDEVWFLSDNPVKALAWESFADVLFGQQRRVRDQIFVFFTSSLEGAEKWAEDLQRAMVSIQHGKAIPSHKTRCFIYIIATNALPFCGDIVITNPGSKCVGAAQSVQAPTAYGFSDGRYVRVSFPVNQLVRVFQELGMGTNPDKVNFFPRGAVLKGEVLYFQYAFAHGLLGIHGQSRDPEETVWVGGVLRNTLGRKPVTLEFNRKRQFIPIAIMMLKMKPGDGPSEMAVRVIQAQLDRAEPGVESKGSGRERLDDFW